MARTSSKLNDQGTAQNVSKLSIASMGFKLAASTTVPTITLSAASAASGITSSFTYTLTATGGAYTISIGGQTTGSIQWNDTAATVQTALNALSTIGSGNSRVFKSGSIFTIVLLDAATNSTYTFAVTSVSLTGGSVTSNGANKTTISPLTAANTSGATPNYKNFLFTSCDPQQVGTVSPNYNFVFNKAENSSSGTPPIVVEFDHYGTQFELIIKGVGAPHRVLVDGVERLFSSVTVRTGTAQAGATNSITLDAGASSTNNNYLLYDVAITSGTGSGQQKRIADYNGTTKVASIVGTWSVTPDATSVFDIRFPNAPFSMPGSTGSVYNLLFDFAGVRAVRKVRVETYYFGGLNIGPNDSVSRSTTRQGMRCFLVGDSFIEGTGALYTTQSLGSYLCGELGWEPFYLGSGGTGYTVNGSATNLRMTIVDRILPPFCSWRWYVSSTGGTYTLSFGGQTTGAISQSAALNTYTVTLGAPSSGTFILTMTNASGSTNTSALQFNSTAAQVQTALNAISGVFSTVSGSTGGPYTINTLDSSQIITGDGTGLSGATFSVSVPVVAALSNLSSVGAGNVTVVGVTANQSFICFRNSLANSNSTLTADITNLTGSPQSIMNRYTGDIDMYVPKDANGIVLPFAVLLAGGLNDNSNPTATTAAAYASVINFLVAKYGSVCSIFSTGVMAPGNNSNAAITNTDAAIAAQAIISLPKINGVTPFIATLNVLRTGSGNISSPTGIGNADRFTYVDSTHPTPEGHLNDGLTIAGFISKIIGNTL